MHDRAGAVCWTDSFGSCDAAASQRRRRYCHIACPTLAQQIIIALRQADPNISQHVQDIVVEVTLSYLRQRADQDHLVDRLAPIYMKFLTKGDVRQLTEFYQSPVGRKLVSLSPQITFESAAVGREWATSILPGLQTEITNRLQKEKLLN
ncbi:MAG: DUF2059 domain-containing protein [Pseudomonadota bacterium]|nr:DUF2059 domain-containing protein [Pseudomonadota bacterium]